MGIVATVQRRWRWLVPIVLVAPAAFFSGQLLESYYRRVERPHLQRTAVPCTAYHAELAEQAPKSCDLAMSTTTPSGSKIETYVFFDGSRLSHESLNGHWRSSSAECTSSQRLMNLAIVAMLLIGTAVVSHSVRTGQWFYFPGMKRQPMNDFETVISIYGACIFAGQMFASAANGCSALAVM